MAGQYRAPCEHDSELPVSGLHFLEDEIAGDLENDVTDLGGVSSWIGIRARVFLQSISTEPNCTGHLSCRVV